MGIISSIYSLDYSLGRIIPTSLVSLAARCALAVPFFKSGLTKWTSFGQLSDTAVLLFTEEFKLHIFGKTLDYPMPTLAAYGAGIGEIILPILLVLGLGTRLAAFGLLIMTAVIQLTVPTGWPLHLTWAALAMAVLALGPGRLAIDGFLGRR
jgi:putative oxidoreductase